GGSGLTISYGFHPSPFGTALVMTTLRGLAGLAFADPGEEQAALADMKGRWPRANIVEERTRTAPLARRIFDSRLWRAGPPPPGGRLGDASGGRVVGTVPGV